MPREARFQLLRPSQIIAEQQRCSLVFLPVGPLEWHGPHLPLGTDPLHAEEVSLRLAAEIGGVVLPPLFLGTERERRPEMLRSIGFRGHEYVVGMDFPANAMKSLYCPEEVLAIAVRSCLDLLVAQGYRLIVILNGHGAENQIQALQRLAVEYSSTRPARVLMLMPTAGAADTYFNGSHATRGETAIMQAITDSVDLGALPEGPLKSVELAIVDGPTFEGDPTPDHTVRSADDPRLATREEGEQRLAAIVTELAETLRRELRAL